MEQKIREPIPRQPICPQCGRPIRYVEVTCYDVFEFKPGNGTYVKAPSRTDVEQLCSHCGHELSEVFPDHVANYVAEVK